MRFGVSVVSVGGTRHILKGEWPMPDTIGNRRPPKNSTQAGDLDRRTELDIIGAVEGVDKSSSGFPYAWDYLRHYESLFAEFRDAPINLIEVGVKSGVSLRLWKWYFATAQIIGIDINPACARLAENRVAVLIGSQADASFMSDVCLTYPPTIFIDDGSHLAEHNIFTFEHVFPYLRLGGIYIVEDLAFHFGPHADRWQRDQKCSATDYFLSLARGCMARQAPGPAVKKHAVFDLVDSVTFIGSCAIIRKKYGGSEIGKAIGFANQYITDHAASDNAYRRLASFILKHDGPLAEAEAACDLAIDRGGPTLDALTVKADILLRKGLDAEARAALEKAGRLESNKKSGLLHLAKLQARVGMRSAAAATIEAALALGPLNDGWHRLLKELKDEPEEKV
jgi:hypothetical protein